MNAGTWTTISRLLDDALELPPSARLAWLDGLGREFDAFREQLRDLLTRAGAMDHDGVLATLPKFEAADGGFAAAIDPVTGAEVVASGAGARIGPYTLVAPIASGGQGAVWLAERTDGLITRPVALKLPHGLVFRRGLAERMARERDILATLAHPHIARLYDAGVTPDGEPYLALEYVEGTAIDAHAQARGLSVEARVRLVLQVVRAVAFAHGRLVIHRDLKPSNVLVTPEGYVRLLDFGIAKLLGDEPTDSTLTIESGRAMTLAYASPEQVAQQPLGVATDIYSLGVVLFELLAGTRPYRLARESTALLEEAILGDEPRRASEAATEPAVRKALAGDLDTILAKTLKKDPLARYASAEALADDLERFLDGRPVLARPDSRTYRATKFVRRHGAVVAVAAASTLAVLLGLGVALWQARVARVERDVAVTQQARSEAAAGFLDWLLQQSGTDRPLSSMELLGRGVAQLEDAQGIDESTRAFLRYEISKHYLRVNQTERELALLTRSADGARRAGDAEILAAAECSAAAAIVGRDLAGAEARLASGERALALVGAPSPNTRTDCLRARAQVLAFQGQVDAAIHLLEGALPTLPQPQDNGWVRHATVDIVLTGLYRRAGRFADAQRVADATVETMRAKGQRGTMNEFSALGTVAANLDDLGEVGSALTIYRDLVRWFERGAFAVAPMVTLTNAGAAELRAGQASAALRLASAAYPAAQRAGNGRAAAAAHLLASRALLALGRPAESRAPLDAAEAFWTANARGYAPQLAEARLHRADLLAAGGRLHDARAEVARVLDGLEYPGRKKSQSVAHALQRSADLALRAGEPAAALAHASDALDAFRRIARDVRRSADVGAAALLRARAHDALGHTREAQEDARLAVQALTNGLGPDHALTGVARTRASGELTASGAMLALR